MIFDPKKFESQLPGFFPVLLDKLRKEGFVLTLVGGAVRDYFLKGSLGKDLDLELTHETLAFDRSSWKELGKRLNDFGKVSFLPYEIIRVDGTSVQLEFSPPRIEHYLQEVKGHSNFEAEFNFKLPFSEAVKRRDFTINSLGVRFMSDNRPELLDPMGGLQHLQNHTLYPGGPAFERDPVRFLRALRFSVSLGFDLSQELKVLMNGMNLEGLTPSYVWSELKRAQDPVSFIEKLAHERSAHPEFSLPIPLNFQKYAGELRKVLFDPRKHETWIIGLEWVNISSEDWISFFSQGHETGKRLARWARTSRVFQDVLPESFHGDFEEVQKHESFEKIFDWYFSTKQLLQKYPELPLLTMIERFLPEWILLFRFDPPKDVKHIEPPLRAKYQVWNLCQRL